MFEFSRSSVGGKLLNEKFEFDLCGAFRCLRPTHFSPLFDSMLILILVVESALSKPDSTKRLENIFPALSGHNMVVPANLALIAKQGFELREVIFLYKLMM